MDDESGNDDRVGLRSEKMRRKLWTFTA